MSKKVDKEKNQHIHVYVRCRPQNASEKKANSQIVVEVNQENREVIVKERLCDKDYNKKFTFDRVFGPENTQIDVYKTVASQCVEEVLSGYNCTVFAYGQTGTGKTYTMQGMRSCETNSWEEDPEAGIVPRSLHHLFDELKQRSPEFTIRVSFLELYNEELFDLLSSMTEGNKLRLYDDITRKGSVVIQGLSEMTVHTKEELYYIMELGTNRRKTACTLMNTDSSRSHTIFSITVHIRECNIEGEELLKIGKLNLVDLAGSECIGRSGAVDRRAREAGNINQSLLTLGRVITALVEKTPHIPYRESKLTRLLQDSLGGRTKTSIIATVSPAHCNLEETLSTLDYAHRAKNITNKPEINQRMTKKMLIREYAEEIGKLRKELVATREKHGIYIDQENYNLMHEKLKIQKEETEEKLGRIQAISDELETLKQLFTDEQKKLEEKADEVRENVHKLKQTSKVLNATCKDLSIKSLERDEQHHLVNKHIKTEKILAEQAQKLQTVVKSSFSDADALHKKLLRKKHLEETNKQQSESFQLRLQGHMAEFFEHLNTSISKQQQNFKSICASIDTDMNALEEQSRSWDGIISALESCHEEEVSMQKEVIIQREKELQSGTDELLGQLSQHVVTTSQNEKEYHTQCNVPLYLEMRTLINQQDQVMERLMGNLKPELEDQMRCLETDRQKAHDLIVEMKSSVNLLLETKNANIVQCQDTVQNVSTNMKNLDQNIASVFNEFDKFVAFKNSSKEKLTHQVQQIANDFSQVSTNLDDIYQLNETLPSRIESSLLKITSETDKRLTSYASNNSAMEAKTLDYISKGKSLSENLFQSLESLEDRSVSHSSDVKKEFESQQDHVSHVIQHIESRNQKNFPEEKRDMDALSNLVHDTNKHHNEVVAKHLRLSEKSSVRQKNETDESSQAINGTVEIVKQFLHQQDQRIDCFVHEEILKDIPTGLTPNRREYSFPRTLTATSPHEKILREFRINTQLEAAQKLPLPDEDDSHDVSFSSSVSDDGSVSSKDSSSRGKENWKKPKTHIHPPTPVEPLSVITANLIDIN